jgi:uncharacterized repeat protein (TIGR01451 family)
MGVGNDYDAYAVTKFAIFCMIGQADVNLYKAEENDSEAQAMLTALHNLVNIGLYGTETYSSAVNIQKSGDFIEDGNYYSQTYTVSSSCTLSEYEITSVTGLSDGDIITDVNGNIKTTFSSCENFKVKILKSNLNSDKNINIGIQAKIKSFPIFYGKTRIENTQNYAITTGAYEYVDSSTNLNLKTNTGKIIVNKLDEETKEGITDTSFELYNSNNELVQSATTNENGTIEFSSLYQGKYTLKETKANENYILNENAEYSVDVNYNKTSTVDIENEHKKGNLTIYKVDKDYNNIVLGNVGFELYNKKDNTLVGTYYTDADGVIELKDLRTGNYVIKEISTNKWYNLAENIEVEVKWNETTETKVEDELKKSQVQIIKVDKDDNNIRIPNVVFEVLDENQNVLETITTNEEGEAYTKEYPVRDYQKIYIREIQTDDMYELDSEIKEVILEENQIKTLTLENEKIRGTIEIIKTSKENSDITGINKGEALEGVGFEVYDSNGNVVDNITTNSNGIATSKELEKGTYKVKEISTNEWFLLDTNYYEANIETQNQKVVLNLENTPAIPNENVEKTGPETAQAGEEIEYKINLENTGNVDLDDFCLEDEIPTDYIKVTKIKLGTFNQKNTYNLYYKTNFSDEYILLMEDISTLENEEIDFSQELSDNEYITNIKLDFGTVSKGFKSNEDISIYAKVKEDVERDDVFENKVTLQSNYKGYNLSKQSSWKTKIQKILPITGM